LKEESMTQLGGSFRFVQLPAVTQLLAELGSTGRLCVTHADWAGEIVVHEGQIIEARLGAERGRAALEGIALALSDGEFSFVDDPVAAAAPDESSEVLLTSSERGAYLDRLGDEHQRLAKLIPSLKLVPRLVEAPNGDSADTQVTIGAAALQLIPALVFGHPLDHVARQRGLARTLREVAVLMEGGLVKLEPAPSVAAPEPVIDKPLVVQSAAVQPVSSRSVATRPFALRAVGLEESTTSVASHPVASRLSFARRLAPAAAAAQPEQHPYAVPQRRADAPALALVRATPSPVSTEPEAAIPPGVAARLATARQFVSLPATNAPSNSSLQPVPFATWRKAIVGFFIHDGANSEAKPATLAE
jgi:hypothetical protein